MSSEPDPGRPRETGRPSARGTASRVSPRSGRVVVLSGPSGAGKSSVVRRLLEICPLPLRLSISATTRPPRTEQGRLEQDGVHYHFLPVDEFARRRARGDFLECKEVFGRGYWYGTLREEVTTGLQQGKWVILEIDVQGMAAVVQQIPDAVTIFLDPGSMAELERRLRDRGSEDAASLQRRLEVAAEELRHADRYQHRVVNRHVEQAAREICDLLQRCGEPA